MTDTPETPIPPTATEPAAAPAHAVQPDRLLYQVAAWVVIVAGIVFIVSVIFFSGAAVGRHHPCPHGMYPPGGAPAAPPAPPAPPSPPASPAASPPAAPSPGPGAPGQPPPPAAPLPPAPPAPSR